MTTNEFDRVWRLLGSLFPAAAAKKTPVDIAVWRRGLSCYGMEEVSDRVMDYARNHKFFPDLADITAGLTTTAVNIGDVDEAFLNNARVYARILGVKPPETLTEAIKWMEARHFEQVP